jgi:hypothetical protein
MPYTLTAPNKAVERTGKKLALFPRRSPPALGVSGRLVKVETALTLH